MIVAYLPPLSDLCHIPLSFLGFSPSQFLFYLTSCILFDHNYYPTMCLFVVLTFSSEMEAGTSCTIHSQVPNQVYVIAKLCSFYIILNIIFFWLLNLLRSCFHRAVCCNAMVQFLSGNGELIV